MKQRAKSILFLVPLFLFILLGGFLLKGLFSDPTKLDSALIGKTVPEFELPDLYNADRYHNQSIIGGQPLLINVWATWCPTCYQEHSFLNELLATEDIFIIGLNYKDDSRGKAVQWLQELGDPYQINLFDYSGLLALDLGVYGAPETFVVDHEGVIRYRHVGDLNTQVWQTTVGPIYYEMVEKYQAQQQQAQVKMVNEQDKAPLEGEE